MEPEKSVHIACLGADVASLDEFVELQGDLKSLSKENYEALKTEIIEQGFSFPPNVWFHDGKKYLLDGHQRVRVLRRMREEGFTIPPIPFSVVEANSMDQAKIKLLGAASQYGKTEEKGLAAFISDLQIAPLKLKAFPLPQINMAKFVQGLMDPTAGAPPPPSEVQYQSTEISAPEETSKLILFLKQEQYEDVMQKCMDLIAREGYESLSALFIALVNGAHRPVA